MSEKLSPTALKAVVIPSVEMILWKVHTEADVLTSHLPRKVRARAKLLKSLELITSDVSATPIIRDRTAAEIAALMRNRAAALEILQVHVPLLLKKLP